MQRAIELAPPARDSFIEESCGGDAALRAEVESLLKSYESAGDFIETPAFAGKIDAASKKHSTVLLTEGTILGHYKVIRLIGRGGMGDVYLAEDTRLRRQVALKILFSDLTGNRQRLMRFEREAQAASALNHPNIITIYEISEAEGINFIVTEYIEGETLHRKLQHETLDLRTVLNIAVQIASALDRAHRGARLIHRDIKPENIMVRPDGLVKILDFGIAKLAEENDAETFTARDTEKDLKFVVGTKKYMSPEQARAGALDARSDIWSFGVVLLEMLAGKPLPAKTTAVETAALLVDQELPTKIFRGGQFPPELESIVRKTRQENPADRYPTSKELLDDLQKLRNKLEIEAILESSGAAVTQGYKSIATEETAVAAATADAPARSAERIKNSLVSRRGSYLTVAILSIVSAAAFFYFQSMRQADPKLKSEINSLAVLPFKSPAESENYLGLGIADTIIRKINQTGTLTVRPTSSVRRYQALDSDALSAARELGVDAVLDGFLQKADDRLRVSVNLLRVSDGGSIWSESFDLNPADIFTVQEQVAGQVVKSLRLRLNAAQQKRFDKIQTSNGIAYEYYLRGINSLDQRHFGPEAKAHTETTIGYFKEAVDNDPDFALAHAQLAFSYAWMAVFVEPDAAWANRAEDSLKRAEALDPQLAEIHMTRYLLLYSSYKGFQIEAAIREILLAQQLNPNIGHEELGNLYQHIGLEDLAERELQKALEIDPTSEYVKNTILGAYRIVKKFDAWTAANQRFFENRTKPTSWFYIVQGKLGEGEKLLASELDKSPKDPVLLSRKALLLSLTGNPAAAKKQVQIILSNYPAKNLAYHHITYDLACVYAVAGESDEAVRWLRETAGTGFPNYPLFERDPLLDKIRKNKDFMEFMEEIKSRFDKYKSEFE